MTDKINDLLTQQPILLFDGECGFCNQSVQFFLKREKRPEMNFAALQSEQGKALKSYFELGQENDSIILIKNNEAHIKSCAALRLAGYMKWPWPLLKIFMVIPPFLRNPVYDFIAKNRMKLMGRVEHCALLSKEDGKRFLDR